MRRLVGALVAGLALTACGGDAEDASQCDVVEAKAAQQLVERLRPGQTGCLREGDYGPSGAGGYALLVERDRITVRSYPGERARLTGPVSIPKGTDGVTLTDLDIDDETAFDRREQLTLQVNGNDTRLEDLDITSNASKTCVVLGGRFGRAENTVLRDSRVHDCGDPGNGLLDHAVYVANASGTVVEDNVIEQAAGYAVHLYPNADGSAIRRNVMRDNGGGVIFGGMGQYVSSANVVEQNLIAGSRVDPNLALYWEEKVGTGNVARGNCLVAGPGGNVEPGPGLEESGNVTTAEVPANASPPRAQAGSTAVC